MVKSLNLLVGVKGFEPSTPCTPCKCATRLRHTPSQERVIIKISLLDSKCFLNITQHLFQFIAHLLVADDGITPFI